MKKSIINLLVSLLLIGPVFTPTASAQQIGAAAVKKFVSTDGFQSAGLGVLIKEVETGNVIAEYQSNACRIPASVTKLISTATAMEVLSDTFRFETKLTYSGNIENSVLHGNLYIVGGGDPTFESDYFDHKPVFDQMVTAIRDKGIKSIDGDIVGDASLFQRSGANGNWLMEDIGSYYGQTPSALCFHDNLFMITCSANDSTGVGTIETILPRTRLLHIDNRLIAGVPTWWRFYGDAYSWDKILRGRIPADKKSLVKIEMPDAALLVADSLRSVLKDSCITSKNARSTIWSSERAPRDSNLILTLQSQPLSEIIKQTNFHSVNLFAENLFLYLGLQRGEIANYDQSTAYVSKFWNVRGVPTAHLHQVDGSGLSMKNAISPSFLTNMLVYMRKTSKYADSFTASLPAAGKDGTVKTFMGSTLLKGKAFIKSGSMDRVQNFAGYVYWNKKWYALTIMVNNFDCTRKQVRTAISNLLVETFKAVGGPDAVVKKAATKKNNTKKK